MDFVKATIKSKKHTSLQKVYALKLLHKCVMRKNKEFAKYVEKKILKRLVIYGEFNKDKTSAQELIYKGEFIFSNTEADRKSAATFLILLLDCLEKWGQAF